MHRLCVLLALLKKDADWKKVVIVSDIQSCFAQATCRGCSRAWKGLSWFVVIYQWYIPFTTYIQTAVWVQACAVCFYWKASVGIKMERPPLHMCTAVVSAVQTVPWLIIMRSDYSPLSSANSGRRTKQDTPSCSVCIKLGLARAMYASFKFFYKIPLHIYVVKLCQTRACVAVRSSLCCEGVI